MRKASDEPLRKITMSLFERDVDLLQKVHGWGYSTVIRAIVRAHCLAIRERQKETEYE